MYPFFEGIIGNKVKHITYISHKKHITYISHKSHKKHSHKKQKHLQTFDICGRVQTCQNVLSAQLLIKEKS